jgi:quinol-cytochrome oxidoreductase complex cytochrome b subunit
MAIIGQKLVQQIKSTGWKATLAQRADDAFTRFTSGLSWDDTRGLLRGDPAPKPNPRVAPHTEGFWFHIRPTFYHEAVTTLYPTFRLGFLSWWFFVFETITGIYLMIFYTPAPAVAYANMIDIMTNVPFGKFMRDLHRLGAEGMVIIVTLHMWRTFITASYKKPRQFTWFTGVILLIITMFLSFSGYLLPWDQLAFWAVTIGTSMADAAPVAGPYVNVLLRGAPEIGAGGLLRFYLMHVLLFPLIGLVFIGVHYYKVVRFGLSLPPEMEKIGEDTARKVDVSKRVPYMPDILTNELVYVAVLFAILAISAVTWYEGAPLENHSNPLQTPLHTVAPWYFYWLQGLIKIPHIFPFLPESWAITGAIDSFFSNLGITPKTLWGIVIPPLVIVLLVVIPYIDPNPSRRYQDRKVAITLGVLFELLILYLSLGGIPEGVPITGFGDVTGDAATEVNQHFIPDEGESIMKHIPFDQLPAGTYDVTENIEVAGAPVLTKVIHEIREEMKHRMTLADPKKKLDNNATATVTIADMQSNLKSVTITVRYTDLKGEGKTLSKSAFVHKDAGHVE